jgi:hypothetical protein
MPKRTSKKSKPTDISQLARATASPPCAPSRRRPATPPVYPPTKAGRLAALRQQLRAMDADRWPF